jgi:hypothetical protein
MVGNIKVYISIVTHEIPLRVRKKTRLVLVPECGEYEISNQKIILRSISRQPPFFIDRFHRNRQK